jgi:hypothetical protein
VGGSTPGIAPGPLDPTVYSVDRTCITGAGTDVPFARSSEPVVPAGKRSVDWRAPLASVETVALATWSMPAPEETEVTTGSSPTRTMSETVVNWAQGTTTCLWEGR